MIELYRAIELNRFEKLEGRLKSNGLMGSLAKHIRHEQVNGVYGAVVRE